MHPITCDLLKLHPGIPPLMTITRDMHVVRYCQLVKLPPISRDQWKSAAGTFTVVPQQTHRGPGQQAERRRQNAIFAGDNKKRSCCTTVHPKPPLVSSVESAPPDGWFAVCLLLRLLTITHQSNRYVFVRRRVIENCDLMRLIQGLYFSIIYSFLSLFLFLFFSLSVRVCVPAGVTRGRPIQENGKLGFAILLYNVPLALICRCSDGVALLSIFFSPLLLRFSFFVSLAEISTFWVPACFQRGVRRGEIGPWGSARWLGVAGSSVGANDLLPIHGCRDTSHCCVFFFFFFFGEYFKSHSPCSRLQASIYRNDEIHIFVK